MLFYFILFYFHKQASQESQAACLSFFTRLQFLFKEERRKRWLFFGTYFISQGKTEEVVEANSVDSAIQQVVGSGGQRVIAIVTDGVPLSSLQTAIPTSGLSQPFILTMQDGQQGKKELNSEGSAED